MNHVCYLCLVIVMHSRLFFVVTCWERADLLALDFDVKLCFCQFRMWYPGSGVVLDCIDS